MLSFYYDACNSVLNLATLDLMSGKAAGVISERAVTLLDIVICCEPCDFRYSDRRQLADILALGLK